MSTFWQRLGGLAHRRPWAFILVWLLLLGGVLSLAATSGGSISSSMTIDETPSQQVIDQLHEALPEASGGQGTIVFTVPEGQRLDTGEPAATIADAAIAISALPEVVDRSAAGTNGQPAMPNAPGEPGQGEKPPNAPGDPTQGEQVPKLRPILIPACKNRTVQSRPTPHSSRAADRSRVYWCPSMAASRCCKCSSLLRWPNCLRE